MADDPLAPIQAGDDVRKILSASRQNALADAARIVRGSLPVRWARRKRPPRHRPESPILVLGGRADKFELYQWDTNQHYTGTSPGHLAIPAGSDGVGNYTIRWADSIPTGFPKLEDHPLFEWVDVNDWKKQSIVVKRPGLYRCTLAYSVTLKADGWALSNQSTSTDGSPYPHNHSYRRAPEELPELAAAWWVGNTATEWLRHWHEWHLGGSGWGTATVEGSVTGILARWASDLGITAGVGHLGLWPDDPAAELRFNLLQLAIERIGEYVAD